MKASHSGEILNFSQINSGSNRLNLRDCKLLFNGYSQVFLSDDLNQAVYILPADGQSGRQILSSNNISNPYALAIQRKSEQKYWLYVGMKNGMLGVFKFG